MIQVDRQRRAQVAAQLAADFRSLPNVACDDFFAKLTRSMCSPGLGPGESLHDLHNSSGRDSTTKSSDLLRTKRHVKVYCRLRELDPRTGRDLVRRQLTRVREEDEALNDTIQENYDDAQEDEEVRGFSSSRFQEAHFSRTTDDFGAFLMSQRRSKRAKLREKQGGAKTGRTGINDPDGRQNREQSAFKCCELFLIHDSHLVIHKTQLAIEAQLLARRLARLMASSIGSS